MHDYQLEHLNTRSFEQLIQALSLEIIGKQVTIFGDGPDGGREATFEGPVKYPEGKSQWSGYGIIQAKFRQQPDAEPKKNADWAIAQVKEEFAKLRSRIRRNKSNSNTDRLCPEYYVFATNVVLTPTHKKGGKDRIRSLFDGFKKTHGLKGYAIWDRDQLRRFLDSHISIRMTYAAWLLPGDVLSQMMDYLKINRASFASTMRRYLESELLDDQFAKLSQGGYTDANSIPLSRVFVDLPVTIPPHQAPPLSIDADPTEEDSPLAVANQKRRRSFLKLFFEQGRQNLKPSANTQHPTISARSRRAVGRIVLIGGPGQGKTTIGQFACQLLRAAILDVTEATYSIEVSQALERIRQQSQNLPKSTVLRYPLRIDLKRFAESLVGEGAFAANSLLDYIVRHMSARTDSELSKDEFRTWLKNYPWLLVLDGLDEVPASSNRTKLLDSIRDFISIEANQQDADLLVLATTRPQGYSDEFDPDIYSHLPLAPLSPTEASAYGQRLAQARHPGNRTRLDELARSLKRATVNHATARLMESPLQVTIMLALIEGGGEPPRTALEAIPRLLRRHLPPRERTRHSFLPNPGQI